MKKSTAKKGFTLIELIIVIAILGILAAVAIPRFTGYQEKAKVAADKATAKTIANATAVLIANGDITVGSSELSGIIKDSDTDTIGDAIEGQLNEIPTPQATGDNFKVVITATDGEVAVYSNTGTTDVMIYPTPETPYN